MNFDLSYLKKLREQTGVGMLDCKKALESNNGDFEKSVEWLRKKGLSAATKKSGRIAAEGSVAAYIHGNGRIGVLLEVNSETDFVARNDEFKKFVHDLTLHITASNPLFVQIDEIPESLVNKEREILKAKNIEQGKKTEMIDKIVEGQIKKWSSDICLMTQKFIKNPELTVSDQLSQMIAKIGENIVIRRFVRFELGEGIEKKKDDFAKEVAAQIKG